jgi:hypothetical protein
LENASCTQPLASGRRSTSPQTSLAAGRASARFHQGVRAAARASIAGAMSTPTISASGKRRFSGAKKAPVPQPRSAITSGAMRMPSRCSSRRRPISRCSALCAS